MDSGLSKCSRGEAVTSSPLVSLESGDKRRKIMWGNVLVDEPPF